MELKIPLVRPNTSTHLRMSLEDYPTNGLQLLSVRETDYNVSSRSINSVKRKTAKSVELANITRAQVKGYRKEKDPLQTLFLLLAVNGAKSFNPNDCDLNVKAIGIHDVLTYRSNWIRVIQSKKLTNLIVCQ